MDHGGKAREGWCMLRCAGGAPNNSSQIVNHPMLRFRPIAPKPVSGDTFSGNMLAGNKNSLLTSKRSKRKYVRVRKNNGYRRKNNDKNNTETDHEDGLNKKVVTLQLLPERPTVKDKRSLSWFNDGNGVDLMMGSKSIRSAKVDDNDNSNYRQDLTSAIWLNLKRKDLTNGEIGGFGGVSRRAAVTVVETWATVESVTGTCMDNNTTATTMKVDLDEDTCPGFVSDGSNRVVWVNRAYKKMVMNGDGGGAETDVVVWLVIKEELPSSEWALFTTKVRLQYTWREEKYSKTVPCDVFRMDGGVLAWRLDVEAALSLGR